MPEKIRPYCNISLLYDKVNDLINAELFALKGLKKDPNNEELLYMLAYLYSKDNKIEKAKKVVENLVKLDPSNTNYLNFLNQLKSRT